MLKYVNPIIGCVCNEVKGHGGGKNYPGAVVPYGFVQCSPDTITGGDDTSGYSDYGKTIEGFSFTHLSGVGWYGDLGNIQVMPLSGELRYYSGTNENVIRKIGTTGWETTFDKETERISAGYYAVTLKEHDIKVECTALPHAGVLKIHFKEEDNHIIFNLSRRIGGKSDFQEVEISKEGIIKGKIIATPKGGGFGKGDGNVSYNLYFYGKLSVAPQSYTVWDGDRFLTGEKHSGEELYIAANYSTLEYPLEVFIAISYVDAEGAYNNYLKEFQTFDEAKNTAESLWCNELSVIQVEGGSDSAKTKFYTALYHASLEPRSFVDCDGRFAIKDTIYEGVNYKTIFSGWDIYRSLMPLNSLIRPKFVQDVVETLRFFAKHNENILPKWEMMGNETSCMIGNPAINIICDVALKEICKTGLEELYQQCLSSVGRRTYYDAFDISYCFETSYTAWCLLQFANQLNKKDIDGLKKSAEMHKTCWDKKVGYPNVKDKDGNFLPFESKYSEAGCCEANIYQQMLSLPHVINDLEVCLGKETLIKELTEFFDKADLSDFWNENYNHSNEPAHGVSHIFNYLGLPEYTQKYTRAIQEQSYGIDAKGLCGNDDTGQMSAWFVLTAMGLYQPCLCSNVFEFNTPLFQKVVIQLDSSVLGCKIQKTLELSTDKDPEEFPYIETIYFNGKKLENFQITWEELSNGGQILFKLKK